MRTACYAVLTPHDLDNITCILCIADRATYYNLCK